MPCEQVVSYWSYRWDSSETTRALWIVFLSFLVLEFFHTITTRAVDMIIFYRHDRRHGGSVCLALASEVRLAHHALLLLMLTTACEGPQIVD